MTNLKVGIYLPSFGYSEDGIDHAQRLRDWCVRAEQLGFDSIWVTDHMLRARNMYAYTWLEPLTTLAFAAAVTKTITLGTGVLLLPLRQPVLLAKTMASIQQMSNNRFILGAGTGWYPKEMHAMGVQPKERGARTDEVLDIARRLMSGEELTYSGKFYDLENVHVEPSPTPLPVWVGGGSQVSGEQSVEKPVLHPRVRDRIVNSDGWFSRPSAQPAQVADDWKLVAHALEDAGRNPDEMIIAHGQWLHLTEEDTPRAARRIQHRFAAEVLGDGRDEELLERSYMFGTLDEVVAQVQARVDVGVEHLIIHPYTDDPAQLELWGSELLPRLKSMQVSRPTV
ncbi:MAG: TIGR03619 family F420-dependent LLM class oxidoreductase [Rhodococcus fascians]